MKSGHLIFLNNQIPNVRKKTEFSAYTEGRKVNGKKVTPCHILRLGKEDRTTERSIFYQKDNRCRLLTNSPAIRGLRSQQRYWAPFLVPFISVALSNNIILYDDFIFAVLHNNTNNLCGDFRDGWNEPAVRDVNGVTPDEGTLSSPAQPRGEVRETHAPCHTHHHWHPLLSD